MCVCVRTQYLNRSPRWQREDREKEEEEERRREKRKSKDCFRVPGEKATPTCDHSGGGGSVGNEESSTDKCVSGSSGSLSVDSRGYHPSYHSISNSSTATGNTSGTTLDQEERAEEEVEEGEEGEKEEEEEGEEGEEGDMSLVNPSCVEDNSLAQSYSQPHEQPSDGILAVETLDQSVGGTMCLANDSCSSQNCVQETLTHDQGVVATSQSSPGAAVVCVSDTVGVPGDGESNGGASLPEAIPEPAEPVSKPVPEPAELELAFPLSDQESTIPSPPPPRGEELFSTSQMSCSWALNLSSSSCGTTQQASSEHPPAIEEEDVPSAGGLSSTQNLFELHLTPTQQAVTQDRTLTQQAVTQDRTLTQQAVTQDKTPTQQPNSDLAVASQGVLHLEHHPDPEPKLVPKLNTEGSGMELDTESVGMELGTGDGEHVEKKDESTEEQETPSSCSASDDNESHDPTPPDYAGCGAAGSASGKGGEGGEGGEGRERDGVGDKQASPSSEACASALKNSVAIEETSPLASGSQHTQLSSGESLTHPPSLTPRSLKHPPPPIQELLFISTCPPVMSASCAHGCPLPLPSSILLHRSGNRNVGLSQVPSHPPPPPQLATSAVTMALPAGPHQPLRRGRRGRRRGKEKEPLCVHWPSQPSIQAT